MGIKNFYNSIIYNNEEIGDRAITKNLKKKKNMCDFFYLDFNSILYLIADKIEVELNNVLYCLISNNFDSSFESNFNYIKSKYNLNGTNCEIIDKIKNTNVDDVFESMLIDYILELLDYFIEDKLKIIFISIDGMPNMSKIYEQRKKKYSAFILNRINKIILKSYENKISEIRLDFEKKSFTFDRSKINPHSLYFNKIIDKLKSIKFKNNIKSIFNNIENIIISHNEIPGEGEKKIMEHINLFDRMGTYCIYSPDSDVIVLSLLNKYLIKNSDSQFLILKYDFTNENLNLINIDIISSNIIKYILKIIKININLDESNIIKDICFLFSIFGNDYIPKIFTINIEIHLNLILEKYIEILLKNNNRSLPFINNYMISFINEKYEINWIFLKEYFSSLKEYEHNLYSDIYIEKNYNKYWIKKYSKDFTLTETLYKFVHAINNILFLKIYEFKNLVEPIDCKISNKIIDNCSNDLLNYFCDKNNLLLFLKFIISSHKFYIDFCNILDSDEIDYQIRYYLDYIFNNINFEKKNNLVKKSINIISKSIKINQIKKKIEEVSKIKNFECTDYDIEIFKIEKRFYPWNVCFNDIDDGLGHISFNYTEKNNIPKYEINRKNNVKENYYLFLNNYLNIDKTDTFKINKYCEYYVISLHWLMDYYFNKNNKIDNNKFACLFSYNNHYSPSLYMISNYMNDIYNNYTKKEENLNLKKKVFNDSLNYDLFKIFSYDNKKVYVDRKYFLNKQEHYMFINPVSNRDNCLIDNIFMNFRNNKEIFPDLKTEAIKIYENKSEFMNIIDCKGSVYNSTCELKNNLLSKIDFNTFKNYITEYLNSFNIFNDCKISLNYHEIYLY